MIDRRTLARMKRGVTILNTARGGLLWLCPVVLTDRRSKDMRT